MPAARQSCAGAIFTATQTQFHYVSTVWLELLVACILFAPSSGCSRFATGEMICQILRETVSIGSFLNTQVSATCLTPAYMHPAPDPNPGSLGQLSVGSVIERHTRRFEVSIKLRATNPASASQGTGTMQKYQERELLHQGHDGPPVKIPMLGLGVWLANPSECQSAIDVALKHGYRHIDTATLYGNEKAVGKAVRASGIPREDIFVTTKLWNTDHGYQNTLRAFDRSLKELGLDYVDLYLIHSPLGANRLDSWKAMEDILLTGKARAIGVSNYGIHHLKELFGKCRIRPSVNQVELNPFCTRDKLVQFCREENIVLEAYSPLTRGKKLNDPTLVKIAKKYDKSAAQVLIRWCLQKDFVTLPKSVTSSRIIENAQVYDFEISQEDMEKLDSLNENFNVSWDPTTSQ